MVARRVENVSPKPRTFNVRSLGARTLFGYNRHASSLLRQWACDRGAADAGNVADLGKPGEKSPGFPL